MNFKTKNSINFKQAKISFKLKIIWQFVSQYTRLNAAKWKHLMQIRLLEHLVDIGPIVMYSCTPRGGAVSPIIMYRRGHQSHWCWKTIDWSDKKILIKFEMASIKFKKGKKINLVKTWSVPCRIKWDLEITFYNLKKQKQKFVNFTSLLWSSLTQVSQYQMISHKTH